MKQHLISIACSAMVLAGCQTTSSGDESSGQVAKQYTRDNNAHLSAAVYSIQFDSAIQFNLQAQALEQSVVEYCSTNNDDLEPMKLAWQEVMGSWMALQGQERGPTKALEESWNVQFWPDKKNTTGLKMSRLTQQDKNWSQAEIAQQSVTVQGVGALEWLLYDDKSPLMKDKVHGCQSAQAIANNLVVKSQKIASAWQQNPWLELDAKQWDSEYIALLTNQLDYSMKKLSRPMAKIGQPRPYFSESWRSETSMTQLKANLEAMQALYFANGDGLDALLRDQGLTPLADRVSYQFSDTIESWPTEQSLFKLLQTKEGYRLVLAQYNKLDQLKYLIHDEVAIELGVIIGFNATDGD
ncbi:imelysin family protein [Vibrio makurazakiensis]|uniref:imelysin family protein n=1 Tax=Vibrio makurazakiensis TaxID=2910250 RepID=UPI003D0E8B8F